MNLVGAILVYTSLLALFLGFISLLCPLTFLGIASRPRGIAAPCFPPQGTLAPVSAFGLLLSSVMRERSRVFGALAEFERSIIRERTTMGLVAARGRAGGRPSAMSAGDIHVAKTSYRANGSNHGKVRYGSVCDRPAIAKLLAPIVRSRDGAIQIVCSPITR